MRFVALLDGRLQIIESIPLRSLPEYRVWWAMRSRCKYPTHHSYARYGGRGIKVCERWENFIDFYNDLGARPSADHTIERRDNAGHYEPDNCYWATRAEQGNNKGNTVFVEYEGERIKLMDLCAKLGAKTNLVRTRLALGMPLDVALTKPVGGKQWKPRESRKKRAKQNS